MVRIGVLVGLAVVLLASGTTAFIQGLADTSWELRGRLRVSLGGAGRISEQVDGEAVFWPGAGPAGDWCVVTLSGDGDLLFAGQPRRHPTRRLRLDPGEGETLPSFEAAFGDAIRERLRKKLRTDHLDEVEAEVFLLDTFVNGYRGGGRDHLRVGIRSSIRYTGWSGGRHARVMLKILFRGTGDPDGGPVR